MDQQAFVSGQRHAAFVLASWHNLGYRSLAECKQRFYQVAMHNLQYAQQQLCSPRNDDIPGVMEKHVVYLLGCLSVLER